MIHRLLYHTSARSMHSADKVHCIDRKTCRINAAQWKYLGHASLAGITEWDRPQHLLICISAYFVTTHFMIWALLMYLRPSASTASAADLKMPP